MLDNIYKTNGIKIALCIFCPIFFYINETLGSSIEMKNNPDTLTITEQDDGDTIQVALGTILILKLEAIPGTGYSWNSDSAIFNNLNMINEPIFLPRQADSTKTTLGAPAYQVFHYLAHKRGTELLKLSYMRNWEKDKPPLKSFSITVSIKE